jgi:hypothetical protein
MGRVVVVFDAYSRGDELIAAGAALARRRNTRLEVISVVSPVRSLLIGMGVSYAGITYSQLDQELSSELCALVASVPADVPVHSRLMHGGRAKILRQVAATEPLAVIAKERFGDRRRLPPAVVVGA